MLRTSMALVMVALIGCDGGEDLAGLIGVQNVPLTLSAAGIDDGTINGEGQVTAGSFLSRVEDELGRDVTRVELLSVTLRMPAPVADTGWSDLFAGQLTVSLVPDATGLPLAIAIAQATGGSGDIACDIVISKTTLDAFPDIAAGRFKVRLGGPVADDFGERSQAVLVRLELIAF